jgi:hypothetical protein
MMRAAAPLRTLAAPRDQTKLQPMSPEDAFFWTERKRRLLAQQASRP